MPDHSSAHAAQRLRTALDMFDAGVDLMRQKLRRAHPDMSDPGP